MIDTIQMKMSTDKIHVEHEWFFKHKRYSYTDNRKDQTLVKATNNDYRREKKKLNQYVPKFWIEHTTWNKTPDYFVLEFSIPKFLFDTSLYAVTIDHYAHLVEQIQKFLREELHVHADFQTISEAVITQAAFCKNIRLDDTCTTNQALETLAHLNYRPRSSWEKKTYENEGGTGIKMYNTASSFAVYEKLPEVAAHAVTMLEIEIGKQWRTGGTVIIPHSPPLREAIRFEFTLQNKNAVNQTMKKYVREKKEYTLHDLFTPNVAKEILRQEVDQILNHPARDFIFVTDFNHPKLVTAIRKHTKSEMYCSEILVMIQGIKELGLAGYRRQFLRRYDIRTWHRRWQILRLVLEEIDWHKIPHISDREILLFLLEKFEIKAKYARPKQLTLL